MITILLAQRLAERRMTQADLARKTGIRPSTITEYYHDFAERVNLEHLEKICTALHCDVCDLLTRRYDKVAQSEKLVRRYVCHTGAKPVSMQSRREKSA